jgi:hypothetical protein
VSVFFTLRHFVLHRWQNITLCIVKHECLV